jgi:ribonuclease BN (tRNA processing enzyme)
VVELTVTALGSTGAYPEAGRACSGFLVRSGDFRLVMDLGYGTFANLARHLPPEEVDAVIVTHAHPDHYLDLHALFRARHFSLRPPPPLRLYAPAGVWNRLVSLEQPDEVDGFRARFAYQEIAPGDAFRVGPFSVRTTLLPHWVPNAGLRLEADGRAVAYTGDTGPSDAIPGLAEGADLFIAEATDRAPGPTPPRFHLRARDAAGYAARAGAVRLLLTHFWPGIDRERSRAEAASRFAGPVLLADEHLEVRL